MKTNPEIVFRKESDLSGVLFNPENGETYGLNPTAALLWESFAEGLDLPQAIDRLRSRVKGLPDGVAGEIGIFAGQLRDKGFLIEE